MKTGKLITLLVLFLIGIGIFVGDYFLTAKEWDSWVFTYLTDKHKLLWMVEVPKALIKDKRLVIDWQIKPESVDIPVNKLKFYQDQYQMIPNVICDEYNELNLERNYQIKLSTYENTKLLEGIKMFDLKYNENPEGNASSSN